MPPDNENGRPGRGGRESSTAIKNGASVAPSTLRHPKAIAPVYEAGIVKRVRPTRIELEHRRTTLVELARSAQPATVRHVYYRAVVEGLVEKSESGYCKVQRDLVELRRAGAIPYSWIEDTGRRAHYPLVRTSPAAALSMLAYTYARDPWQAPGAPRVEIWCESRSIAGTLTELVDQYAVPIFPIGGQTSDTFAYEAATSYRADRRVVVFYAGDYDPAGREVASQLEGELRHHADDGAVIEFATLTITDDQALTMQALGTKPKKSLWRDFDGEHHEFRGQAIELEAVDPVVLRRVFSEAIEQIAYDAAGYNIFAENLARETIERAQLAELAAGWSA